MEARQIEFATVDIGTVQPHPKNVRQGDIGAISQSLKAHGQYRPIVVDRRTNQILAGNHTWRAAKSLGWSQIAVGFIETKDDDDATRILLADNRTTDLASYDDAGLADLLKELIASDDQLVGTLYDGDDLDDLIYKLEGSLGTFEPTVTVQDLIEEFANKDTKNLTLPYSNEQIIILKNHLRNLQTKMVIDNWAEIIFQLAKTFDENN